ncbi:MAG TPA: amino acid permease, partial [Chthoniobacterales bacterium]
HLAHLPWRPFASGEAHGLGGLAVGISLALWNYIGWDNPSTVQGEVKDASRSYPRALAIALPFVIAGYLLPLLAALGGMVSALALFNALLLSYSRIPFVLASDRLLPQSLARLDLRVTPWVAVVVSAVFYSLFVLVPFGKLVVADVLLYSLALFLEFGALVRLRKTEPSLRGAFRIPLGRGGVACLAALPMIVLLGVIAIALRDGEYGLPAIIGSAIAIAAGPLIYQIARRSRA